LLLELLVEAGFEFTDFATAETSDVNVIARAVRFVVVAVAAEVKEVELVDEALAFEEIDGAVDGDEVDFGVDGLGAGQDLVDVEVLFGGVHDLKDDAPLAGQAYAALAEGFLKAAAGFGRVDAFAAGDSTGWSGGHRENSLRGILTGRARDGNWAESVRVKEKRDSSLRGLRSE
jgi:hypothetical protein